MMKKDLKLGLISSTEIEYKFEIVFLFFHIRIYEKPIQCVRFVDEKQQNNLKKA